MKETVIFCFSSVLITVQKVKQILFPQKIQCLNGKLVNVVYMNYYEIGKERLLLVKKSPISHIAVPEVDSQCSLLRSFHLHTQDHHQKQYLGQWW